MAKREKKPLSDDELKALVDAEIASAMGAFGDSSELSQQRGEAMDRYLGEPMGNEIEGRSQVMARDVLTTIEWMMPSLMRVFTEDSAVEIDPVGPEDEEAAEQETDYLNHLFFNKMQGFLVLYSWFKDALIQKNGIVMHWAENYDEQTRETFEGLTDEELTLLMSDPELELVEHDFVEQRMADTGQAIMTHNAAFERTHKDVRFHVDVVPPEEFIISKDARSVDPKKARFCGRYRYITASELKEMGYTDAQIDLMEDSPSQRAITEEALSRNHLEDEQTYGNIVNSAMREKEIVEAFVRADANGDGIAELLKIFRSGDFIEWEEADSVNFNALTPIILTHKFHGLSVAELLTDIQDIRTSLYRLFLDNAHQAVNGTTYFNDRVNLDDMLTSLPYGVRHVAGDGPVGDAVMTVPPGAIPPAAFELLNVLDKMRAERFGDFQTQLDPQIMKEANNGVVFELLNEAWAKVWMIAKIFASTGVCSLYRDLHEMVRKHATKEDTVRMRNRWVPIDPRTWKQRMDFREKAGLGTRNRRERQMILRNVIDDHNTLAMNGGMGVLVTPQHMHKARVEYLESFGEVNPEQFYPDPASLPPPQQPEQPPDPALVIAQLTAQIEQAKLQMQSQKNQVEAQLKNKQLDIEAQNNAAKQQLEKMRQEIAAIRAQSQNATDQAKVALDNRATQLEGQLERARTMVDAQIASSQQVVDQYKAELQSSTQLAIASQKEEGQTIRADQANLAKILTSIMGSVEKLQADLSAHKEIKRDAQGNIVSIGGKRIKRDASGFLTGIE